MNGDGRPAFPAHPSAVGDHDGMTLRDYFAAKAMQGAFASTDDKSHWPSKEVMALAFYAWADAMLNERAK